MCDIDREQQRYLDLSERLGVLQSTLTILKKQIIDLEDEYEIVSSSFEQSRRQSMQKQDSLTILLKIKDRLQSELSTFSNEFTLVMDHLKNLASLGETVGQEALQELWALIQHK